MYSSVACTKTGNTSFRKILTIANLNSKLWNQLVPISVSRGGSGAVRFSSRAVRLFPALLERTALIRDFCSYGVPRKLRADPYGSYDKTCYSHVWRYDFYQPEKSWYFTLVYIIKNVITWALWYTNPSRGYKSSGWDHESALFNSHRKPFPCKGPKF